MKHTLATRLLAIALVVVMVLSYLPGTFIAAFAADVEETLTAAEVTIAPETTVATTETGATVSATTAPVQTLPATEVTEEPSDAATPAVEGEPTEEILSETSSESVMFGSAALFSVGDRSTSGSTSSSAGKPQSGGYVDQNTDYDPSLNPYNREVFFNAVGVTMQVVYFPYGESYNRYNSYDNIISTLKNYTYTDETGEKVITVYDGKTITDSTFIGDPATGRIYKVEGINFDQSTNTYKTFELVTGRHDDFGGTIHPGFHDTVSGPATVTTENGITTYTMPEPTDIELFLKHIIFGSDYGAWDKTSVAKDANGNNTANLEEDVSLYTKMLKYLGCSDKYIQNYLDSYNERLSVTNDADVMIPTIIWSYVMADCAYATEKDGTPVYGHGYIGDNSTIVQYKYVDPYAVSCCDGSDFRGEDNNHGAVTNVTVDGKPYRRLITSVQTVGDIVYKSYLNNVYRSYTRFLCDAEAAETYWNHWWKGEILKKDNNGDYPLKTNSSGTLNTIASTNGYTSPSNNNSMYRAYHNQGGRGNGCSWFTYASYSCYDLVGVHGVHNSAAAQRNYYGRHAIGSGYVNYINADGVDANDGNKHYFRGYWTPFGEMQTGTLELKKNVSSEDNSAVTDLSGWRFEIYETEADARAGINFLREEYTDSTGSVLFEGLRYGDTFYIKEAPLERQDKRHSVSGWTTSDQIFVGQVPLDSAIVIGTATNTYVPGRTVSITKSPSCSNAVYSQIANNPLYSLAGAEYTIYLNGVAQEVLVTNANGMATSSKVYNIGATLTIRETKAPAGFKLSNEVYTLTVIDGTNHVAVKDEPVFDPGAIMFQKGNASTGSAMGNTSYEGAIFKWEYFDNDDWSGSSLRTWYFVTDAFGIHDYNPTYLLNNGTYFSDELFVNTDGLYSIPLGSVKITEVVAPEGYALMEPLYAVISQPSSGGSAAFDWTDESWEYITTDAAGTFIGEEPIDEDTFGSVSVQKLDAQTGTTLQGDVPNLKTKFQVINRSTNSVKILDFAVAAPGEVCYEFWTNNSGSFVTGPIFPIGSYELIEAVPPTGMTLNSSWSKTFTITSTNKTFNFTSSSNALKNDVIRGGVMVYKYDSTMGENTDKNAMLNGITFSVISLNSNPVVVNGVTYNNGDVVATMDLAWSESSVKWQASLPGNTLPYGTYKVIENPKEAGSSYANDYYILTDTSFSFTIRTNGTVVNTDTNGNTMAFHNMRTGGLQVMKMTNTGANRAGWIFEVRDSSGTVVATITTNSNGIATCDTLLPGKYTVKEVGGPAGMWGSGYWICDTTSYNITVEGGSGAGVTVFNRNTGSLIIQKKTNTGISLRGWVFRVWDERGMYNNIVTTDATGKAEITGLDPGTYYVQEVFNPDAYWEADVAAHKVTIVANSTYTHEVVNDHKGKVAVQKTTNTGEDLAGWVFAVKNSDGTVVATLTTDASGYAESGLLLPGNYTIQEIGGPAGLWNSEYWAYDVSTTGDINIGRINLFKYADMSSLSPWAGTNGTTRSLSTMDGHNTILVDPNTGTGNWGYLVQTVQNVSAGTYTLSADIYIDNTTTLASAFWNSSWVGIGSKHIALQPGWNHVEQTITISEDQTKIMAGWGIAKGNTFHVANAKLEEGPDATAWTPSYAGSTVSVLGGTTAVHNVTNNEYGRVEVQKSTNTGTNLGGWIFNVKDRSGNVVATLTTGENGYAISDYLAPGSYTIQEVGGPDGLWGSEYWECDTTTHNIVVSGSSTTTHKAKNNVYGTLIAYKQTNTGNNGGWMFGVWKVENDGTETFIGKKFIASGHSTVSFTKLEPGTYRVREILEESDPGTDLSYWESDVAAKDVTVVAGASKSVRFDNTLKGKVSVQKTTNTGEDLAGWVFAIKHSSGNVVATLITDENGYAESELLTPGSYTIQEVGGPDGNWNSEFWAYDVNTTGDVYIGSVNLLSNAELTSASKWVGSNSTSVSAASVDGKNVVYIDPTTNPYTTGYGTQTVKNTSAGEYVFSGYVYCDTARTIRAAAWYSISGWISIKTEAYDCKAGWNYIEFAFTAEEDYPNLIVGFGGQKTDGGFYMWHPKLELGTAATNWTPSYSGKAITVVGGSTATHNVTNNEYGRVEVQKSTNTGTNLDGWIFNVKDRSGNVVATLTTDENGYAISDYLAPGSYTIQEVGGPDGLWGNAMWECDTTVHNITVSGSNVTTHNAENKIYGSIVAYKTTNTGDSSGWTFGVWKVESNGSETLIGKKTIGSGHSTVTFTKLEPGKYIVRELISESTVSNSHFWEAEVTEKEVTVVGGDTKTAQFNNLLKGTISITKITSTNANKAGWVFEIKDENGLVVDTMTTDSNGRAESKLLMPGRYTVQEVGGPEGMWGSEYWICDTNSYSVIVEPGVSIGRTVFNENTGSLIIQKQSNTGVTLRGWIFTVRSADGLVNTSVTTDKDGLAKLTGLRPGKYFIQEAFKPDSYWEADVSVHEITIVENATYTHYATNDYKGKIAIQKHTNTGKNLEGWLFEISPVNGGPSITLTTDKNGYAETDLLIPGMYMIRELNGFLDHNFWFTEQEIEIVAVSAGQTYTYDITNYHMGRIMVQKSTNTGNNLGGWVFEILDSTGKVVDTVTTNDEGNAFSKMLMPGEYTVREIGGAEGIGNSGYWVCDTDSEIVTVEGGKTVNAQFSNTEMGKIAVQKATNTGTDLDGWLFAVKDSSGAVVTILTTDASGYAETDLLPAGKYTVLEIGSEKTGRDSSYWGYDVATQSGVTVGRPNLFTYADMSSISTWAGTNGTTRSLSTMDGYKTIHVDPSTSTGTWGYLVQTLQNAPAGTYTLSADIYVENTTTLVSAFWNSSWTGIGSKYFNCYPGWTHVEQTITISEAQTKIMSGWGIAKGNTFHVRNAKLEYGDTATDWTPSYKGSTVSAVTGSTTVHTVTNKQFGDLLIQKQTNTGNNLGGWVFTVTDSEGNEIPGSPFTTDDQGQILIDKLEPGKYTVQENAIDDINWLCDVQPHSVTVVGGEVTTETVINTQRTSLVIKKVMLNDGPLDGWIFTVKDAAGNEVSGSPFTTDETGIVSVEGLAIGEYTIEEIFPENSLYYCVGENPVTVQTAAGVETTVEFQNALRPGSIIIEKVDYFGNHLSGAEFYLEWSEDNGTTWNSIAFHEGEYPVKGGCSSAALADGKLTTDETGFITFDGLYPGLMYRVTETKAPDGYVLLADYAFTGELPAEDLTVSLKIYNSQGYLLPSTGEDGFTSMIALGTAMFLIAIFGCVMWVSHITQATAKVCYSEETLSKNKNLMQRRNPK